jgi:hypothetical protein
LGGSVFGLFGDARMVESDAYLAAAHQTTRWPWLRARLLAKRYLPRALRRMVTGLRERARTGT